jgi:hypothetical protein
VQLLQVHRATTAAFAASARALERESVILLNDLFEMPVPPLQGHRAIAVAFEASARALENKRIRDFVA